MQERTKHILLILIILISSLGNLSYAKDHELDKEVWKEVIDGENFEEATPKIEKPSLNSPNLSWLSNLKSVFKVLLYILLILLIGFIIYKLGFLTKGNTKFKPVKNVMNLDELEDHIDELDFDQLLKDALANDDFKLAIRVYFLIALKNLSLGNRIEWSNEKTNQEYLFEMSTDKEFNAFRQLIYSFELAWYSDHNINRAYFDSIEPKYTEFINRTAHIEE